MSRLFRFATYAMLCGTTAAYAQEADSVFNSLDKDGDGILVADEVPEAQQRFFERLVRAGDENEDGKLSKAEYQATLEADERPAGTPEDGRPSRGPGRGGFDPGAIFDRLDTNQDGKLTKSELPAEAAERMGRLFDALDKEELTRDDMREAFSRMMRERGAGAPGRPEGRPPGGEGFFARLDANKDGKLSKEEIPEQMRDRMAPLFDRVGSDEIDLAQLDRLRGGRPGERPEGERGDRPEMRREEARRDGDRPESDRRREEPGRPERGGDRPEFAGRGPGFGGPGRGPAFVRILDTDENGRISKAEALHIAKLFDELDRNEDGELDGGELMGFEGRPGFGGPDGERGRPEMARRPEGRSDGERPEMRRGDGRRPEGDRPEGARPEGRPEGRPGFGPEAFMSRFDENKDGAISKDEAPDRMAENFDRLDQNGDGKITADEFSQMFNRGGRPGGEGGERRGFGRRGGEDRPERPQRPESDE